MLKVISGRYKGLAITAEAPGARPMMARMREALFMVLELRFPLRDAHIIDLFAGSGILTLEALSRGAATAALCDSGRETARLLRHKLPPTIYKNHRIDVYHERAEKFIRHYKARCQCLFLDPPYRYARHQELLRALASSSLINESSVVVLHHEKNTQLPLIDSHYQLLWQKRMGAAVINILRARSINSRPS